MRVRLYSDIEKACLSQGDLVGQSAPTTGAGSDFMEWINQEWAEIYDKLVVSGEKYFMVKTPFVTVANIQDYQLPNDFYKIRGVEVQLSATQFFNAHRFNFEQRNDYQLSDWSWPRQVLYDIWGQPLTVAGGSNVPPNLHFIPKPIAVYNFNVYYFQPAVILTATTQEMDLQAGHEKALVFGVCARAALRLRQFEFADRMLAEREKQLQRIVDNMRDMDQGEPHMVRVVRGKPAWRAWRWWRWLFVLRVTSSDPSPATTVDDVAYAVGVQPEPDSERSLALSLVVGSADFSDGLGVEAGTVRVSVGSSAAADRVRHVVRVRAWPNMPRVATDGVVA